MAKLDGKRVLACCANGAGSSLMTEKAIQKVLSSAAKNYDIVFCSKIFFKNFENVGEETVVIPLKNVMSDKEIEAALRENGFLV